jgi:hypothetical protein
MKNNFAQSAFLLGLALLFLEGAVPSAAAQSTKIDPAGSHQRLISMNPFGYVFEWYNIEYEQRVGSSTTLGFTGSFATPSNATFGGANALFRFYPQGMAFKGLYVGGRTGVYYLNDMNDNGTVFGAGLEIGYTWLMGARKNWYLGLGLGLTRIFGGDLDGSAVIPQARFVNFGYAF